MNDNTHDTKQGSDLSATCEHCGSENVRRMKDAYSDEDLENPEDLQCDACFMVSPNPETLFAQVPREQEDRKLEGSLQYSAGGSVYPVTVERVSGAGMVDRVELFNSAFKERQEYDRETFETVVRNARSADGYPRLHLPEDKVEERDS